MIMWWCVLEVSDSSNLNQELNNVIEVNAYVIVRKIMQNNKQEI